MEMMSPEQINSHLALFHEKQERIASEEKLRLEKEEAAFHANCAACESTMKDRVEPLLRQLSELLAAHGHDSVLHPTQETEHTTERTKLRSIEYAAALAVERPKGVLILRVVATPQTRRIASLVGVPHGNCSSVFHAGNGPLGEAEDVTNLGIADFMASAFPLR